MINLLGGGGSPFISFYLSRRVKSKAQEATRKKNPNVMDEAHTTLHSLTLCWGNKE